MLFLLPNIHVLNIIIIYLFMNRWFTYISDAEQPSKMNIVRVISITVLVFLIPTCFAANCYDTWSKCSGWSSFLTNILWLDCDRCCKCKGKSSGSCVERTAPECFNIKAYQCICATSSRSGPQPDYCSSFTNTWSSAVACK